MSSLRDSYINLSLPGTPVPGYRLYRPCGTAAAPLRYAFRDILDEVISFRAEFAVDDWKDVPQGLKSLQ